MVIYYSSNRKLIQNPPPQIVTEILSTHEEPGTPLPAHKELTVEKFTVRGRVKERERLLLIKFVLFHLFIHSLNK